MRFSDLMPIANMFLNMLEIKLKRTRLLSRPVTITLEPTLACNSDCIMCNRNYNRKGTKDAQEFLSWDTFNKVRPLFKYARCVSFCGFGESLLHPEFPVMLKEIKKTVPFVFFYSNAIAMTEEVGRKLVDAGLDRICISIGGATRETYKKIRGVDAHDQVMNNIRQLQKYKKNTGKNKPDLFLEVVAMNSVLPELELLVELARELGAVNISMANLVAQGEDMKAESIWLNINEAQAAFANAAAQAKKYGITFQPPSLDMNHTADCSALFKVLAVNWDGSIVSCARERYIIGDLNTSTVDEIWNSKGIMGLRKDYFERGLKHVCPQCTCWDNSPDNYLNPQLNSREYATRL